MTNRVALPQALDPIALRPPEGPVVHMTGPTMGVDWRVQAVLPPETDARALGEALQAAVQTVVDEMSSWQPDSAISRFNAAPAGTWFDLPPGFRAVLEHALAIAEATDGAFDPTVGDATDRWGFGPPGETPLPTTAAPAPGWRAVRLEDGRLLQPGGLAIDLAGIAKGYGVDRLAAVMADHGHRHFLAEIGGEFVGAGLKPDRQPWWVSVEQPPGLSAPEEPLLFGLHGLALATSGDYRRFRMDAGRRQTHSIDPATGAPVEDAPASVTVVAGDCMTADALCTALTVMGADRGLAFAEANEIACAMVLRPGGEERISPALQEMIDG